MMLHRVRTAKNKFKIPISGIGCLMYFIVLTTAFPARPVMANPVRDPDVPLTFHIVENGVPVRSPVDLVYTCSKSSAPVFSVRCTEECVIVVPHSYLYGLCNLSVAPAGREAFEIGGFAVTDFYFYADRSTYHATIDIGGRSCSYSPNFLDKSFLVSGCNKRLSVDAVTGGVLGRPWILVPVWIMTVGVECAVALLLHRFLFNLRRTRLRKILFSVAIIHLVTLPMAWLTMIVIGRFVSANYVFAVSIAELLVVAVEALFYRKILPLKTAQAVLLSAAANIASYLCGVILFGV
jgi:hypothetical protein